MYPIAHAWLVSRLIPSPTDAHFLGCVWPDMLFGSPLDHARSHTSGRLLVQHTLAMSQHRQAEEFRAFVAGVLTHGSEPHGFDWYSDDQYGDGSPADRGYAFQMGRRLARSAARACGLAPEQGWWKAHNVIEMAFERALLDAHPGLGACIAQACADVNLTQSIASEVAPIFEVSPVELAEAMRRFPTVVSLQPDSHVALAEIYARQVQLKHSGAAPDVSALTRLIARAEVIIEGSGDTFLHTCTESVGAMLFATLPG